MSFFQLIFFLPWRRKTTFFHFLLNVWVIFKKIVVLLVQLIRCFLMVSRTFAGYHSPFFCCNMYKPGISEWNQTSALDIWDVKLKTLAKNYLDVLRYVLDVIEQWHQVHELYSSRLNFKQNQMSWPLCHNYLEKLDTILWKWWINVIINNSCVDAFFSC